MRAIVVSLVLVSVVSAFASDETVFLDQALQEEDHIVELEPPKVKLAPSEIYRRTQMVFRHFQVPAEPDFQSQLNSVVYTTPPEFFATLLKSLDPSSQFARLFVRTGGRLISYKDRDARQVAEYQVSETTRRRWWGGGKSLRGLRVALDPGHMGGDLWDVRTGKYVRSGNTKLSEGILALQTALLIEQRLRAMGAQVLITHRGPRPVTNVGYDQINIREFGRRELRNRSLEAWFQSLLSSANNESDLGAAFAKSAGVKKVFSENARSDYFAMREDLTARDRMIGAFKPDLTLIIHFDSATSKPTNAKNRVRAYVPGSFGAAEFATGEARAHFLTHLAQGERWRASVELSKSIVGEISSRLSVPIPATDMAGTLPVARGVFARNLALTRLLTDSPVSYLECLYYGNSQEFAMLARKDGGTLSIDGKSYPYSARLKKLSDAIVDGVVKFKSARGRR